MAEVLARSLLDTKGAGNVTVSSAGTGALDGTPASEGAYLVSLERGLDLSSHRARYLTPTLVREADLVLTMSRSHKRLAEELGGKGKTYLLGEYAGRPGAEAEVSDPFGADLDTYRTTFEELQQLITAAFARVLPDSSP